MRKNTFLKLFADPNVFYIYDLRGSIFGIDDVLSYIVVVSDDWKFPSGDDDSELVNTDIYKISTWFKMVMNCDMLPWMCACADKKYVLKEHVKLLMTTNPLLLRKNWTLYKTGLLNNSITSDLSNNKIIFWKILRNLKFTNQIIENHKIANLKSASTDFEELNKCISEDDLSARFTELSLSDYNLLGKSTDGLLLKDKIEKWEQSKKS